MSSRTSPVPLDGFRFIGDVYTEFLTNSLENVSSHPQMISRFNTFYNANLEFPLWWSTFCIDPSNLESSIETSSQMCLSNCSAETGSFTDGTIVSALRIRKSSLRPTERPDLSSSCSPLKEILLLYTKPRLMRFSLLHNLVGNPSS